MDYSTIDLLVYHGGCTDGVAGAWCFWSKYMNKNSEKLVYGKHGENIPDAKGKNVLFVDIAPDITYLSELLKVANHVRVLDHHASTKPLLDVKADNFSIVLDMDRSGAQIAWDEAFPNTTRPWYIEDIADRDLWKWSIPDSKNSTQGIFSKGLASNVEKFDNIQHMSRQYFTFVGSILNDNLDRQCKKICDRAISCTLTVEEKKYRVKVVECDSEFISEVGNRLVKDAECDFSVMYRFDFTKNEWWLSLRASQSSDIDLVCIAKYLDPAGGGHKKAAGATLRSVSILDHFVPVEVSQ